MVLPIVAALGGMGNILNTAMNVLGVAFIPMSFMPLPIIDDHSKKAPIYDITNVNIFIGRQNRGNNTDTDTTGGFRPAVSIFNELGNVLAHHGELEVHKSYPAEFTASGEMLKYDMEHLPVFGFEHVVPDYIVVQNTNEDEVCISRVSVTSEVSGVVYEWFAPLAEYCGGPWYYTGSEPDALTMTSGCVWLGKGEGLPQKLTFKVRDFFEPYQAEKNEERLLQYILNPAMICDSKPRQSLISNIVISQYATGLHIYDWNKEAELSTRGWHKNPGSSMYQVGIRATNRSNPWFYYPSGPYEDHGGYGHNRAAQANYGWELQETWNRRMGGKRKAMTFELTDLPRGGLKSQKRPLPMFHQNPNRYDSMRRANELASNWEADFYDGRSEEMREEHEYLNEVSRVRGYDKYFNETIGILKKSMERAEKARLWRLSEKPEPVEWDRTPMFASSFGRENFEPDRPGDENQRGRIWAPMDHLQSYKPRNPQKRDIFFVKDNSRNTTNSTEWDHDITRRMMRSFTRRSTPHPEGAVVEPLLEVVTQRKFDYQPPRLVKREHYVSGSLVKSHQEGHSAVELCGSTTSRGPDFVSIVEGMYCDMQTRHVWHLCSESIATDCFDNNKHELKLSSTRKRDERFGWTSPKIYRDVDEWKKLSKRQVKIRTDVENRLGDGKEPRLVKRDNFTNGDEALRSQSLYITDRATRHWGDWGVAIWCCAVVFFTFIRKW